jgi:1,4-dihydroxy-6-naphthoate synthase
MSDTKLLQLGHSPDPDDAFMFYGLARDKFPTGRYRFKHVLQDIQTLSHRARSGELEITAISIHAYPYVADKYALTSCGSSMGDNYGPMVVATKPMPLEALPGKTIAIPGELTTAFLSLQLCLGRGARKDSRDTGLRPVHATSANQNSSTAEQYARAGGPSHDEPAFYYEVVHFDQIPQFVRDGRADAGLIIHEGQLTYEKMGLHLIADMGVWWMSKTGLPLPLGGNCIRKDLGQPVMQEVTDILRQSIQYSLDHRPEAVEYSLQFGRDLDAKLADRFVGMYVNHWTLDYGDRGREAITRLLREGAQAGLVPDAGEIEYVTAR